MTTTASRIASLRVKSNARYTCQECESTEKIQAHHKIPKDDNTLVVLCANCHSKKHPRVPWQLFHTKSSQPYWENKSASTLARDIGVHPKTVWRAARRLSIPSGVLTNEAEKAIRDSLRSGSPKSCKCSQCSRRGEHRVTKLKSSSQVMIDGYQCERCDHPWVPRDKTEKPTICPRCKSPYYDKPRKTRGQGESETGYV